MTQMPSDSGMMPGPPPPTLPPLAKPRVAEVLGILSLVFAVLGVLGIVQGILGPAMVEMSQPGGAVEEFPSPPLALAIPMYVVHGILAAWLAIAGVKIWNVSRDSIRIFKRYCIVGLLTKPVLVALTIPTIKAAFEYGAKMEMRNQRQPMPPGLEDFMDVMMGLVVFFSVVWSVAFEVIGLWFITRPKTASAFSAYQDRKRM